MHEEETFWTLLRDPAHWQFEVFLIILFDLVVGVLLWPRFKRWYKHERRDDEILHELEERVKVLEGHLK